MPRLELVQLNSTPKLDPACDQAWLIGLFKQKNSTQKISQLPQDFPGYKKRKIHMSDDKMRIH